MQSVSLVLGQSFVVVFGEFVCQRLGQSFVVFVRALAGFSFWQYFLMVSRELSVQFRAASLLGSDLGKSVPVFDEQPCRTHIFPNPYHC